MYVFNCYLSLIFLTKFLHVLFSMIFYFLFLVLTFCFENLPSDNFSPESGGSVKPSSAIEAISTQGTIKLKK